MERLAKLKVNAMFRYSSVYKSPLAVETYVLSHVMSVFAEV